MLIKLLAAKLDSAERQVIIINLKTNKYLTGEEGN